ncbi:MAG: EscU/YscU/HrcU family type III secretion system export apparatus switch protein [Kofleriaceae bacterium]
MSERVLPPTPRRRALARAAGLAWHAPTLTAGAALLGAVAALAWFAGADASAPLRAAMRAGADGADGRAVDVALALRAVPVATLALVLPPLAGALFAAALAHTAQLGGVWRPRRRLPGAPGRTRTATARLVDGLGAAFAAAAIVVITLAWLAVHGDDLIALAAHPSAAWPGAVVRLGIGAIAVLAGTRVACGVVAAVVEARRHRRDLQMTEAERRDELRRAGADPRRRARGFAGDHAAATVAGAIARARVVVTDGTIAVAVAAPAGDAPRVVAVGRGPDATSLLARARRDRVPVTRQPTLAAALGQAAVGLVPPALWPELAAVVAASGG